MIYIEIRLEVLFSTWGLITYIQGKLKFANLKSFLDWYFSLHAHLNCFLVFKINKMLHIFGAIVMSSQQSRVTIRLGNIHKGQTLHEYDKILYNSKF